MRKLKINLFRIDKRASLIGITVLLLICVASYFLFFNKKNSENIEVEIIEISSLKLSILNGCGVKGAASEVKDNIINKDFENIDIISWKNVKSYKFIYGKSIIVVKRKDENKLKYLMKITGISRRIYAFDENTIEDFQIILGRDYRTYFK
ncbi:MAG: LytR C-terminal domain-containing protein [Candidatus Cloacimonadota bacterium]|nr:LytR C-terminal domain-containing protein [Candidatus Cloacimonadota bacterium]